MGSSLQELDGAEELKMENEMKYEIISSFYSAKNKETSNIWTQVDSY